MTWPNEVMADDMLIISFLRFARGIGRKTAMPRRVMVDDMLIVSVLRFARSIDRKTTMPRRIRARVLPMLGFNGHANFQ